MENPSASGMYWMYGRLITLIIAVFSYAKCGTSPHLPRPVIAPEPLRASKQVTLLLTAGWGYGRGENAFPSVQRELSRDPPQRWLAYPLSLFFCLRIPTGARRVLRRSGLPRVTCSQGAPRDAAIHAFYRARATRTSRARRTAGHARRFELEFRSQQQGWGSNLVRERRPSYRDSS